MEFIFSIYSFFVANWLYLFKDNFGKISTVIVVCFWLLFFPNAPYIITDIIHLHPDKSFGYWYNLLIVVSCAWNALIMGLLSLNDVQNVVAEKFGKSIAWLVTISSVFLCSFGIYIGRILRWNSWDLFFDTRDLMYDITERVTNPSAHGRTFGITLFYGMFLLIIYLFFRQLMVRKEEA
jgi:uncharacterized membrane protein